MFDFDVREGHGLGDGSPTVARRALHVLWDGLAEPIEGIVRKPALIVSPTQTVEEVIASFVEANQGMALVASHGYLLGTLTEKQILRRIRNQPETAFTTAIWRLMRVEPETLKETDSIGYALHKLHASELPAMPVTHTTGTLAGLLDGRDLLSWIRTRTGRESSDFVGQG